MAGDLLAWYDANRRDLPWRGGSAYAVWVSEIMLQQTQVATVAPFFLRFMERFPTLEALATAPIDEVLKQWAGLGYYARARNLHRAAGMVLSDHAGTVPDVPATLERLPGIGRYTAGAILSIAYDIPRPIVDANVIRVLCRVFGITGDPKSTANQRLLWSLAESLVPARRPGDFNQGLMELGALICRPDEPQCERCPLLRFCHAGNSPDPTRLPEYPPDRTPVHVTHCSVVILRHQSSARGPEQPIDQREALLPGTISERRSESGDAAGSHLRSGRRSAMSARSAQALIVQRPAHGLWGGLWEFPRVICEKGEGPEAAAERAALALSGLQIRPGGRLPLVKHGVTHHRITLYGVVAECDPPEQAAKPLQGSALRWVTAEQLPDYPFSAPQSLLREALIRRLSAEALPPEQPELPFPL